MQLDETHGIVGAAVAVTLALLTWITGLRKQQSDDSARAFAEMERVVGALREDLQQLRADLMQEKKDRIHAEAKVDLLQAEVTRQRTDLAAKDQEVHSLRLEVGQLRAMLRSKGDEAGVPGLPCLSTQLKP